MSKKDRLALTHKMDAKWKKEQNRSERRQYEVEHHPERYPNDYDDLEKMVKQ